MTVIAVVAAFFTVKLLFIVAGIWFVVQGFRVHWGWGVANLLIPGAIIPFCIFHPKEAKRPLILIGICLGVFLILLICARHQISFQPSVEVAPALSASVKDAVLNLKLASFDEASQTGKRISGILSRKDPVMNADPSNGRYDEERLMTIQADGFVIRITDRVGGEMRTNFILFPYGQATETNTLGWGILGDYSGEVMSWPSPVLEPAGDNTFHLLTTTGSPHHRPSVVQLWVNRRHRTHRLCMSGQSSSEVC
jgi:hypothetical protein